MGRGPSRAYPRGNCMGLVSENPVGPPTKPSGEEADLGKGYAEKIKGPSRESKMKVQQKNGKKKRGPDWKKTCKWACGEKR